MRNTFFKKRTLVLIILFTFYFNLLNLSAFQIVETEGKIRIATCQFPVSDDIISNAEWIKKQLKESAINNVDLVHFPECALSGYAGVDFDSWDNFNWDLLQEQTKEIAELASELNLWVLLGSTHRLTGTNKPHNSLYVINPNGEIIDRYDKRFCTKGDLKFYSPGDHFVTFEVNGINCGLLICYDIRFPELYRAYSLEGVQVLFQSFYNARQKPGSIHPKIMPVTAQARAATNYMFMSLSNSSAKHSWPCQLITPDGLIFQQAPLDEPKVLISDIDTGKKFYDASKSFRDDAIRGKLNSGETVDDERSKKRKEL